MIHGITEKDAEAIDDLKLELIQPEDLDAYEENNKYNLTRS